MRVIEFWSPSCGPCKISKAAVAGLRADGYNVEIEELNADENQDLVIYYGVRALPTLLIVDDEGEEVARKAGAMNKAQMKSFIDQAYTLKLTL